MTKRTRPGITEREADVAFHEAATNELLFGRPEPTEDDARLDLGLTLWEAIQDAWTMGGKRHCANCFAEFKPNVDGAHEQVCSDGCHDELVSVVTERALTLYPIMMRRALLSQTADRSQADAEDAHSLDVALGRLMRTYLNEDAERGRPAPREAYSLDPMFYVPGEEEDEHIDPEGWDIVPATEVELELDVLRLYEHHEE